MASNEFRFDPGGYILNPALPSPLNRLAPTAMGASLTISRGQAMARKTADGKMYPLNLAATDGTQIFGGFAQYAFATDAAGLCYWVFGGTTAGATYYSPAASYAAIYTGGIFDPRDVTTAATGTVTAEVDTGTPTSPTTGDIFTVSNASGVLASFTVGATQTAAAVVTGLTLSWNSNPDATAIATASGSSTFILTAKTKGVPMNLNFSAAGTGTFPFVITTPAVSALTSEVDTWTLTTAPSTGDKFTLTITYPNLTTHAVVATVGATATVAATTTLMAAAWNADPVAAAYATATSTTTTVVLTGAIAGSAMNVAMTTNSASTTLGKVVTTPAFGNNLSDILAGCPGARILQPYGYWEVP